MRQYIYIRVAIINSCKYPYVATRVFECVLVLSPHFLLSYRRLIRDTSLFIVAIIGFRLLAGELKEEAMAAAT